MVSVCTLQGQAASPTQLIQQEIDATVWQPFQCAFESMDGVALNRLYAKRVLRVVANELDTKNAFKAFNKTRFDDAKRNGQRIALDFWFDSRATNSSTSYEVGFFRLGTLSSTGETDYYYGQFHIVLKKQGDRWRITQDWDTGSIAGQPITADHFALGTPREKDCA